MKTLKAGRHRLVFSEGIKNQLADSDFAEFVYTSLLRFGRGDWGGISRCDWKANDEALESFNTDGWYGRILATYTRKTGKTGNWGAVTVWIIRNTAEGDGTQAIAVMFPGEY